MYLDERQFIDSPKICMHRCRSVNGQAQDLLCSQLQVQGMESPDLVELHSLQNRRGQLLLSLLITELDSDERNAPPPKKKKKKL